MAMIAATSLLPLLEGLSRCMSKRVIVVLFGMYLIASSAGELGSHTSTSSIGPAGQEGLYRAYLLAGIVIAYMICQTISDLLCLRGGARSNGTGLGWGQGDGDGAPEPGPILPETEGSQRHAS